MTDDDATAETGSESLIEAITSCLADNKAIDVGVIDLHGKSPMADHMVVATGTSTRGSRSTPRSLLSTSTAGTRTP